MCMEIAATCHHHALRRCFLMWRLGVCAQLVRAVGVEPLMEACAGEGPELQAVSMQCIAALTMHDALKAPVLDAEGLAVIGAAARSPAVGVQRPAAAALANLCGDADLLPRVAASPDGIPSLLALSDSSDRIAQVVE